MEVGELSAGFAAEPHLSEEEQLEEGQTRGSFICCLDDVHDLGLSDSRQR